MLWRDSLTGMTSREEWERDEGVEVEYRVEERAEEQVRDRVKAKRHRVRAIESDNSSDLDSDEERDTRENREEYKRRKREDHKFKIWKFWWMESLHASVFRSMWIERRQSIGL